MITTTSFPTPHLALRGGNPEDDARVRGFAAHQARVAEGVRSRLAVTLPGLSTRRERLDVLRRHHRLLCDWRYNLACEATDRLGVGLPLDASRFRLSLRDGGPNADRIGDIGRLRHGARWDPDTRTYQGGAETPASRIMTHYGRVALARFAAEAPDDDVLITRITAPAPRGLPHNGRERIGNRLVRGDAARRIAADLITRIQASGRDTSRIEIGGDPLYVVTPDPDDADVLFNHALYLLADAFDVDLPERLTLWQHARFLLHQAPQKKKGSDAVTRIFVVALGAVLLGVAPVLAHDSDLRCMVLGQDAAITHPADAALVAADAPPLAL